MRLLSFHSSQLFPTISPLPPGLAVHLCLSRTSTRLPPENQRNLGQQPCETTSRLRPNLCLHHLYLGDTYSPRHAAQSASRGLPLSKLTDLHASYPHPDLDDT